MAPMAVVIPDKLYFKIGEVSSLLKLKPHVLRYWETEFDLLNPGKAPSRHRLYRRKDVELLLQIKQLLYTEGYTIDGARKKLKQREPGGDEPPPSPWTDPEHKEALLKIKEDLTSLRDMIS